MQADLPPARGLLDRLLRAARKDGDLRLPGPDLLPKNLDRSICSHLTPGRLTAEGITTLGDRVQSPSFRHTSFRALALYRQRVGKLFIPATIWARLVRERPCLRPRRRLCPPKPQEGVRSSRRNPYWHIEVTVIGLLEFPQAWLAVSAPSRQLRRAGRVDGLLRGTTQHPRSACGFLGADPRRDVFRSR